MDIFARALDLKNETVAHRRYFHENAEIGLEMPKACAYVTAELQKIGLLPKPCGNGVCATLGHGGKTLLLRADMDALPLNEQSGEEFSCKNGNAHACGHDLHAAMLLTVAKILKEGENALSGTVRLMFQPAEETLQGCRNMIDGGVLDPAPDAAMAFHVAAGKFSPGVFMYNSRSVMMNSCDGFRIEIAGKGGHGAYPNLTIDPISIAVKIYSSLQALVALETDPEKTCVLTVGRFEAGNAYNIVPDSAVLEGALRTNDRATRDKLIKRISEICEQEAALFGGSATIKSIASVPPLECDNKLTEKMIGYIKELPIPGSQFVPDMRASASEDFALIAEKISSAFIYLSAGFSDERGDHPAHNSKVRFNEDVLPIGSAAMAHCATRWLNA